MNNFCLNVNFCKFVCTKENSFQSLDQVLVDNRAMFASHNMHVTCYKGVWKYEEHVRLAIVVWRAEPPHATFGGRTLRTQPATLHRWKMVIWFAFIKKYLSSKFISFHLCQLILNLSKNIKEKPVFKSILPCVITCGWMHNIEGSWLLTKIRSPSAAKERGRRRRL